MKLTGAALDFPDATENSLSTCFLKADQMFMIVVLSTAITMHMGEVSIYNMQRRGMHYLEKKKKTERDTHQMETKSFIQIFKAYM